MDDLDIRIGYLGENGLDLTVHFLKLVRDKKLIAKKHVLHDWFKKVSNELLQQAIEIFDHYNELYQSDESRYKTTDLVFLIFFIVQMEIGKNDGFDEEQLSAYLNRLYLGMKIELVRRDGGVEVVGKPALCNDDALYRFNLELIPKWLREEFE